MKECCLLYQDEVYLEDMREVVVTHIQYQKKKSFELLLSYVFNMKKGWLIKELFSVDQFQSTSFRPIIF